MIQTFKPIQGEAVAVQHADHKLIVSFGTRCQDNHPKPETLSIADLAARFTKPDLERGTLSLAEYLALNKEILEEKKIRNAEKNGDYFIMAAFKGTGIRNAANVDFMTGFVGDIDTGNISLAELKAHLQGLAHIIYSSYSHSPDVPKWRFILFYPVPTSVADHQKTYLFLQQQFKNQLDPRCETSAQLWYTPACPEDAGDLFVFVFSDGDLFDVSTLPEPALPAVVPTPTRPSLQVALQANPNLTKSNLEKLQSALNATPADDRDAWIKFGLALHNDIGDTGFNIWNNWSQKSSKYDPDTMDDTWVSFKTDSTAPKVGLGTIFFSAKQAGWRDGRFDMSDTVQKIDSQHFVALDGGGCWAYKEDFDLTSKKKTLARMSFQAVKDFYVNQKVHVGDKYIGAGLAWLEHPARRTFDKVSFLPGQVTPIGTYNLWQGYPIAPVQGNWSLLQHHIHDVICSGDDDSNEYLLNWLAYAIQYPYKQGEIAVVLKGQRGVGKGILAHFFGHLFGEHSLPITNTKHLVGNFNAHLRSCIFLFLDEAIWAGDKDGENILKTLVTESEILIEGKGKDVVKAPNRLHIMMASNNDWVIPAGDHERRFFVLEVSNKRMQDLPYFGAIHDQMTNHGGREAMIYDLLHRDLSTFDIRKFTWTNALEDQIIQTLDAATQWWMDYLGATHSCWEYQCRSTLSENFARANGTYNGKSSETKLGLFFKKMLGDRAKRVDHSFNAASPPVKCYQFPPQSACRQAFMAYLGLKNDPWA